MRSEKSIGTRLVITLKEYINYDLAYIRHIGFRSDIQYISLLS